ncbi:2Fe-2S iron-sulfur cluster-binding protein [Thalassospira marina]|nr:pyridoxamine 5'-phosphate oxidase family protein [Thalassospira marina]
MSQVISPPASQTWHEGERALHQHLGITDRMEGIGSRNIRDHLIEQHSTFYAQLPFIVLGSVDANNDVWATLRAKPAGFMHASDDKTLHVALPASTDDPAQQGMGNNAPIGLLGIEPETRRRNRMNGFVKNARDSGFDIAVHHSFGNCPQYIRLRDHYFIDSDSDTNSNHDDDTPPKGAIPGHRHETATLDDTAKAIIANADTFFVASYADRPLATDANTHAPKPVAAFPGSNQHAPGGLQTQATQHATNTAGPNTATRREVDVSHRGGQPGFVRIDDDGGLTIPDFAGNLFFNTLGNILMSGRAGLVFVDFATGTLLQLTGKAELLIDSTETRYFQGAERLWRFYPTRVIRRENAIALRWRNRDSGQSPNSLLTGTWQDAAARANAAKLAREWRRLEVVRITDESESVRSFYFAPPRPKTDAHAKAENTKNTENAHPTDATNDTGLIPSIAGQYLPLRVTLPNGEKAIRTYTLSSGPQDRMYRISVAKQNGVSKYLHDHIQLGDIIETRAPQGQFVPDATSDRPMVMMAGGIGITPMIAMLRHMLYEGRRTRRIRPCWLFYAARNKADRAFDQELAALKQASNGLFKVIRVLGSTENAVPLEDYEATGFIDMDLLRAALPFDDFDFYLCGPPAFMQAMYDGLRSKNIADHRIHAEAFGPASLQRTPDASKPTDANNEQVTAKITTQPVAVQFAQSAKTANWTPDTAPTLLELAEENGLTPDYGCRNGSCGTCRVKVLQGKVAYDTRPTASPEPGTALLCCARPAAPDENKNEDEGNGKNADTNGKDDARTPLILDI